MLEVSDRAVCVGESGLEMGEDLRGRQARGVGRQPRRRLGRRAATAQGGADLALSVVEPFPDALPGPLIQPATSGAAGGEDAKGDGVLEEQPQSGGGQAEPSDLVGQPDAEGSAATGTRVAIAAKDSPGAHRLFLGTGLVAPVQETVPNERAEHLAVRAARLLEPFGNRGPLLVATEKPSFLAHGVAPPEIAILPARPSGGVMARLDKNPLAGYKSPRLPVLPNSRRHKHPPFGSQFGNIQPKMR